MLPSLYHRFEELGHTSLIGEQINGCHGMPEFDRGQRRGYRVGTLTSVFGRTIPCCVTEMDTE